LSFEPPSSIHVIAALEQPETLASLSVKSPLREFLTRCAAQYLGRSKEGDMVLDPVARFHLGNGARIERINFYADPSPKGLRQSHGLMVNYVYDLKRIDKHRKQLDSGEVPASSQVEDLYFNN
jgi:malonyl-CoA decarboxylase